MYNQHWAPDVKSIRQILIHNDLRSFTDIWNLEADWFETPNTRRGGWSGVCRIELKTPEGGVLPVFLKRQRDHNTRSIRNPLSHPTFREEFNNICKLQALGIPVVPLVYYGEHHVNNHAYAALMTVALDGDFQNLSEWWQSHPQEESRRAVLTAIAYWIAQISKQHLRHGCLYEKHIFIHKLPKANQFSYVDICFIDLEKMSLSFTAEHAAETNIKQLLRHSGCCSQAEHELLVDLFKKEIAA